MYVCVHVCMYVCMYVCVDAIRSVRESYFALPVLHVEQRPHSVYYCGRQTNCIILPTVVESREDYGCYNKDFIS